MIKKSLKQITLSNAIKEFNITFKKGRVSVLNAPPSSGKSYFIYKKFLKELKKYLIDYKGHSKIYYLVDTTTLQEAIKNELEKEGITNIELMTYASFSKDLNIENAIIICDEYQNLYNYLKYNWKKATKTYEGCYIDIIKNLDNLSIYNWIIGLSGTDFDIYNKKLPNDIKVNNVNMFTSTQRNKLRSYNYEPIYVNCIFNYIKSVDWKKYKKKVLLNTRTIKQSKIYKSFFDMIGVKSEWICSIRAEQEIEWKLTEQQILSIELGFNTIEELKPEKCIEKDNKIYHKQKVMTKKQEQLREYVINNKEFPSDLQVLIVNGAYETGWNLENEEGQKPLIQTVIIDSTNYGYCYQSRFRVRHNIENLIVLCTHYEKSWEEDNEDYYVLEKNQYGEYKEGCYVVNTKGIVQRVRDYRDILIELDDKYLGVKLTKKLKDEMVEIYGKVPLKGSKDANWQNTKELIEFSGYVINVGTDSKRESFIYRNIIDKNVEENVDELIEWFENEWDKKRVSCKDVQDELNIHWKTWKKMLESWKLISYMKTNKITQNTIKGLGKTLYFFKN